MKFRWVREIELTVVVLFLLSMLVPISEADALGKKKVFYSGDNYVFSGNWTPEEIKVITRLQDSAQAKIALCYGYITPEEQMTILSAYRKPMILHVKNNKLGKNIGASVSRNRRTLDKAVPLALGMDPNLGYSAMQINVKELFRRGEIEILKTLLHEMAHNASPDFSHPPMNKIWYLDTMKLRPGRAESEYYGNVTLRIEKCAEGSHLEIITAD